MAIQLLGSIQNNIVLSGDPNDAIDYTDFGGNDTYTLTNNLQGNVTVSDNNGGGRINLPGGFAPDSVQFADNGVQFTIGGNTVTILSNDVSSLTFVIGGTPLDPTAGTETDLSGLAAEFGTSVPDSGLGDTVSDPDPISTPGDTEDSGGSDGDTIVGTDSADFFPLTQGTDKIDGKGGDDTFAGTVSNQTNRDTFAPGDEIDGGAGTDTLEIELSEDNFDGNVAVRGIERVFVETTDDVARDFSAETLFGQDSDIQELWVEDISTRNQQAGSIRVLDIRSEDITLGVKDSGEDVTGGQATADVEFQINQDFFLNGGAVGLALNDAENVAVDITTGSNSGIDTVDVLSIGSQPTDNILAGTFAADGNADTMTVEGDRGFQSTLAANFTTFDASAATGDQTITFLATDDVTASGGAGADSLTFANDGDHTVDTGAGNDSIAAQDGNLTATTGPGSDVVTAGDGDMDITTGDGNDSVTAGDGSSTVDVGDGENSVDLGDSPSGSGHTVTAGDGDDDIDVGDGDHLINAGGGDNDITTGDASPSTTTINAGAGDDTISTGDGAFIVNAGDGANDVTVGDTNGGTTEINAGNGNDTIGTGDGTFDISVGDGANTITVGTSEAGTSTISAGAGSDTVTTGDGDFEITTDGGADVVTVGDGDTTIKTGPGNDTVTIGDGNSDVDTGMGNDAVTIGAARFLGSNDELDGGDGAADVLTIGVQPGDTIGTSETRGVEGFETIVLDGAGALFEAHDELVNKNNPNGQLTIGVEGNNNTVSVEELSSVRDVTIEDRGGSYDTRVIGTDETLDGFDQVSLGGGHDVLEVVDGANLSTDDLRNITGLDRIELTADSGQAQDWNINLTDGLFAQSGGDLTIGADANVPSNSTLTIDVGNLTQTPNALQVINSANLNVQFEDNGSVLDPGDIPAYVNVQTGLTLTSNTDTLNGDGQGDSDLIDNNDNTVVAPSADTFNSSDVINAQGQNPFSFGQGGDTLKLQFNPDLLDDTGVANVGTGAGSPDSNAGYLSQIFGEDIATDGSGAATVKGFERISFDFPGDGTGRDVSFVDDLTGDPRFTSPGSDFGGVYAASNGNISDTGQVIYETGSGDDYIQTFQWNSANTGGGDDTVELFNLGDGGEGGFDDLPDLFNLADGGEGGEDGIMPPLPAALQDNNNNGTLDGLEGVDLSNTPLADRFSREDAEPFAEGDFPFGGAADVSGGNVIQDSRFNPGDFFTAPNNPLQAPADTLSELGFSSINDLANVWDYGGRIDTGDGEDRIVMNDASIQAAVMTLNMGADTDILEVRSWDAVGPDGLEDAPAGDVNIGPNYFADDSGLNVIEYASATEQNAQGGLASTTTIAMTNADMAAFEADDSGVNTAVIRPVDVNASYDTTNRVQGSADNNPANGSRYNNEGALILTGGGVTNGRFEVIGTALADEVTTGAGDDVVDVRGGDNTVTTNAGDDAVSAGSGNDVISVGAGNDTVNAGGGDNTVSGGSGDDTITALGGDDVIDGGTGDDTINAGGGDNTVSGGSGNDTITAGGGNDIIDAGSGDDVVNAGAGDDVISGGAGDDTINAGSGDDTVVAGDGDDIVNGGDGADIISGGSGGDVLNGGDGDDSIVGGAGDDTISGGSGSDTLVGNQGDDDITAGEGEDTVTPGAGGDTVDLTEDNQVQDTLIYETGADGAQPGAVSGFDTITGFAPGTDKVQIGGTLKTALDDDGGGTLDFATADGVFNLKDGEGNFEAIEYTSSLGIEDDSLVELNFDTLRGQPMNNLGVESEEEEQGLFLIQGENDTGLYLYNENVGSDANVAASELQLLGLFEDALLTKDDLEFA